MFNKDELINHIEKIFESDEVLNTLLLNLKHKYFTVYKHCLNVCVSSYLLSSKLNLSKDECINIALGGLFHDIGKINIPSKILYKPDTLTIQEYSIIKRHPIMGLNLLNNSIYKNNIENCILYHHERYDGKGYCHKLIGKNIPLEARIIAICDSFDAMISYRSYKKSINLKMAKKELIKNRSTQFDGEIIDAFLEIIDDFYYDYHEFQSPLYINNLIETENNNVAINWEKILDNIPDVGVILIDKYDQIKFANKFAASIRKKKKEELIGTNFNKFHKKHRNSIIKEKLLKVKTGEIHGWERTMKRENIYLENKYIAIHDDNNKYEGLLMLTKDVSEQEKILRLLEKSVENLNILVQANNLLTEVFDIDNILKKALELFDKIINIDYISIVLKKYDSIKLHNEINIFNSSKEIQDYINDNIKEFFVEMDNHIYFKEFYSKKIIIIPLKFKEENRAVIIMQTDVENVIDENIKKLMEVISNYTNSAIQKYLLFNELEDKAVKDNLTGIYNRQYMQKILNSLDGNTKNLGVIIADVNNLKYINDTFGHFYGDWAIKTTAKILKKSIRENDYVFRYGGDEFMAIILNCNEKIISKTLKIIDNNMLHVDCKFDSNIKLTISIGYSISSSKDSINEVIKIADKNMYMQKKKFKQLLI